MSHNIIKQKIQKLIKDPSKIARCALSKFAPLIRNDETFIKIKWRFSKMGYPLNLEHPKTFNEKLQWLKLHNRRPEYTIIVDKIKVKQWVADRIGPQFIIPTLGVWDRAEDIDFETLPNQFVLKCNHNSGGVYICKDKSNMDKEKVIKRLQKELKQNYYWRNREWPYKDIKPRVIAEQYMEDETGELRDYKFFCFDGEVKALFIASDRTKNVETKFDFYDENFKHLPLTNGHPNAEIPPSIPVSFEGMKELAAKLSKGIPQVRVDLYEIRGCVYFGEMTLFHWSGMKPFNPEEWDYKFGSWIRFPIENIL